MSILISQRGKGSILDRMKAIVSKTKDLSPLIQPVRAVMINANTERAFKGLDYTSKPYVALAPATIKDRASKGYPAGPPLLRRGTDSWVIKGCEIRVAQNAGKLQFDKSFAGAPAWMENHIRGGGRLPRRDPLGFSDVEIAEVRRMLPKHCLAR